MNCPYVTVDGQVFDNLEDLADFLPEGVIVRPRVECPDAIHCLCGIDLGLTAEANGYEITSVDGHSFNFLQVHNQCHYPTR